MAETIRVRGLVQGVGFRPKVWRLARGLGLRGDVRNDGEGVLIRRWAPAGAAPGRDPGQGVADPIDAFCVRLNAECPPLARIDSIERTPLDLPPPMEPGLVILASEATGVHTGVVADAATCPDCAREVLDPADRRYRYPFTNCTARCTCCSSRSGSARW